MSGPSKSQKRRENAQNDRPIDEGVEVDAPVAAPEKAPQDSEPAKPATQPTMRLWLKQNHIVAGVLKLKGDFVDLAVPVAQKELKVTRDIYSTDPV